MAKLSIRSLEKGDCTKSFNCGNASLNDFLKKNASQYHKKDYAKVRVIVDEHNTILAYNTLSSAQIISLEVSEVVAKKLPRHPIPVLLIGRLAVCKSQQRNGFGRDILMDALEQSAKVSKMVGIFGVVVDPIDQAAEKFYQKYGFLTFNNSPKRMLLEIKKIREIF